MARRNLYLNGLGISAVVLFHAAGMGFVAMFFWSHRYAPADFVPGDAVGSISYYALRLVEQLVVFAVPAFLYVSGYSIAIASGRDQSNLSWQLIFRRLRFLLIPYLIWSGVVIALRLLEGKAIPPSILLRWILLGEGNEVMYYVPLLAQFYLLAPLFVRWAKKNWKALLLVTGLLQLLVQLIYYPELLGLVVPQFANLKFLIPKWFFITRIFWFPLGIVLGFNATKFSTVFSPYKKIFYWLTLILIPICMIEWEFYFHLSGEAWLAHRETLLDTFFSLMLIVSVILTSQKKLPWVRSVEGLGVKSYGIFLTHAIVIEYVSRAIYHVAPQVLAYQILFQPILIAVGFGVPLLLMYLMDRFPLRRWYGYVFG